uniref:Myoferlin n=1 Tax=Phallusia mammillata TaxID=59560 RepID=A0A6F9DML9_9ASCI|nr:myoferlin [Phallusia mammillata]
MPEIKVKIVKAEFGSEHKIKSPFVTVSFKGIVKKTKNKKGNNPTWNETLTFALTEQPSPSDEFRFEVIEDDGIFGIDKTLGKASISYNALKLSREKELDLRGKKTTARLRVSMADDRSTPGDDGGRKSTATPAGGTASPQAADKEEGELGDEGVGDLGEFEQEDQHFAGSGLGGRADRSSLSQKVEDFQIRLKVICGRQLTGANIKPVVKVKAGKNQTRITRVRKGSSPIWNEMMLFTFHESLRDLYDMFVEFHVNNSMRIRADALIGFFKLDVGFIYDQPSHAFVKKWILLTDPEDPSNTPKGYIKMTICVLGAGDEPPDDRTEEGEDDIEGNVLTPAGAALRPSTFCLRVYGGEDFPQMDISAFKSMKKLMGMGEAEDISKTLVDPYLIFTFAGKKRKTRVVEGSNHPDWNEELSLPVKFPSMCDTIKLTLKDWDRVGGDDCIGTTTIHMPHISSTGEDASGAGFPPTFGPTYINFYGSPREFVDIADSLDALNTGKGEGCAYRGRAMVELITSMDEEGQEPKPSIQSIDEERIRVIQKYKSRRRYRLVVAFSGAGQIEKMYEGVEFEVSMGNYGNKFEADLGASVSTTEPQNPVFDGVKYHFMPWAAKKPVMMVTTHWEEISFRLFSLNFILRLIDKITMDLDRIKQLIEDKEDEIEIASEIVSLLDMIILETNKRIPDPRGRSTSNQLDVRIHSRRVQTFMLIQDQATDLRQNCRDAESAVTAIADMLEQLHSVSFEPQNSFPDVVIWMISGTKRIAYARIPAYDILHCHDNPEYSGRFCSKPKIVLLKVPTAKKFSKKKYKIPCQLQILAWLGRAQDQNDFNFNTTGQISVYADTFEVESKFNIRGNWASEGYKDITGAYPLPKDSFTCPPGWVWEGDWHISSDVPLMQDEGYISYLEECFEHQYRFPGSDWQDEKILNSRGDPVPNLAAIKCQGGWEWEDDWSPDTNRACDEEGWEYCTIAREDEEVVWETTEKTFHVGRRRRLIRTRICLDQKLQKFFLQGSKAAEGSIGDGWEYAKTQSSQFHSMSGTFDMVKRRRWVRKMVTSESRGAAAIFNLDKTVKIDAKDQPLSPTSFGKATGEERFESDESKMKVFKKKDKSSDADAKKKKKLPKMPAPKIYMMFEHVSKLHLRAYIYQARDLLPMDQDNFSDPVVMISFLNYCRRTDVINHTLNPVWNQTLMMDINFYGDLNYLQKFCPEILLEVFDKDELIPFHIGGLTPAKVPAKKTRSDHSKKPVNGNLEFMGRAWAKPLLRFDGSEVDKAKLAWADVRKGDMAGGSILCAFELFLKHEQQEIPVQPPRRTAGDGFMVPFGIRPVLQPTALEFMLWGVRNMESFKLLSVNSPSILIQVGDVEIRTKIIKNLKKNPNFTEPVYFRATQLPVERLYFPPVVIRVKDNRKFGSRPTVGQHIITDVSQYQVETPKLKTSTPADEGYDEPMITDVAIEVDKPKQSKGKKVIAFLKKLKQKPRQAGPREDEIDWWSKFYASIGDKTMCGVYMDTGMDLVKVYKYELEKAENFNYFSDFIQTFKLFRGKAHDDEEPDYAGELKGTFRIYRLPSDDSLPPRYFRDLPSTDPVEVKIRVYVIRAYDLAPQDSNGLADPYLKIKVGKKRILDRDNYIPNSLDPTFGRMFELDLVLPMDKDLRVEVFDWDLIGTDDKIGETVIDLENRYLSNFRAWCGLPDTYYTSGPCPWRDQMTPKDWLYDKAKREKWDEPVWNGNSCVYVGGKTYRLDQFEADKKPSPYWGPAEQRLSLHILKTFPHVSEHVETRPLYTDLLPGIQQGSVQLWVDMFPKDYGEPGAPFNIDPRKPSKYFIRVIIWNCSEIPMMDTSFLGDQMTDIYFKGYLTGLEHKKQKTDVHYRSLDGTGMFNWRYIFPFNYLPQERLVHVERKEHLWSLDKTVTKFPPVLNIQVWDNDLFGPNEYISEISLPLTNMAKCCKFQRNCKLANVPDLQGNCEMDIINLFDQKLLKGWWPLYRVVEGQTQQAGKLEMSVEIVTEDEHEEKPAGPGRDEPNLNPKLEKPKRPATSFAWFSSPFKSLRYIIWRKYKWFILGFLGVALLIIFFVLFFYSFPGALVRLFV